MEKYKYSNLTITESYEIPYPKDIVNIEDVLDFNTKEYICFNDEGDFYGYLKHYKVCQGDSVLLQTKSLSEFLDWVRENVVI